MPAEKFVQRYRIDKPDRFRLADFDTADTAVEARQGCGQGTARRRCRASWRASGAALRGGQMVGPDCAAGNGHRRQGRCDQARHGGRQSAGLRRPRVQGSERRGDRSRFPLAIRGAVPERGRIGIFNRSHYEEVLVVRVHPDLLARQKLPPSLMGKINLGASLQEHPRFRAPSCAQRNGRPQILPAHLA